MWRLHPNNYCPSCGAQRVARSRRHGVVERVLLRLLPIRPYRCGNCGSRFYGYHRRLEVHLQREAQSDRE